MLVEEVARVAAVEDERPDVDARDSVRLAEASSQRRRDALRRRFDVGKLGGLVAGLEQRVEEPERDCGLSGVRLVPGDEDAEAAH